MSGSENDYSPLRFPSRTPPHPQLVTILETQNSVSFSSSESSAVSTTCSEIACRFGDLTTEERTNISGDTRRLSPVDPKDSFKQLDTQPVVSTAAAATARLHGRGTNKVLTDTMGGGRSAHFAELPHRTTVAAAAAATSSMWSPFRSRRGTRVLHIIGVGLLLVMVSMIYVMHVTVSDKLSDEMVRESIEHTSTGARGKPKTAGKKGKGATPSPAPTVAPAATAKASTTATTITTTAVPEVVGPSPWSVLVRHADAMTRLDPSRQEFPCRLFHFFFCDPEYVPPTSLPSWTLHVVDPRCPDCTDTHTYAEALAGNAMGTAANAKAENNNNNDNKVARIEEDGEENTRVPTMPELKSGAVFASAAAPLGRIGPMLLAMAGVTDDVDMAEHLPQWQWMHHLHHSAAMKTAAQRKPAAYLAVMGIPSTDQPARVPLRHAQRQTWLQYSDIARAANNFEGALLPLYLFAAAQPNKENGTAPVAFRHVNATDLVLTREEYAALSDVRREGDQQRRSTTTQNNHIRSDTTAKHGLAATPVTSPYTMPRVTLRELWNTFHPHDSYSPCVSIVRTHFGESAKTRDAFAYLSQELALPATPAFVAAPDYICHASAALWQEALTHRNVIWIDMMTDRTPTTDKKLGDTKKWGLPVEVGMSQKLILWLSYAYHAFPDVPFIIKGDDDAYVKVPQFLNDVRYLTQLDGAKPMARAEQTLFLHNSSRTPQETICTYWGSTRSVRQVRFNAGMHFMLHRSLIRAMLEPHESRDKGTLVMSDLYSGGDAHVWLAVTPFNEKLSHFYYKKQFNWEDVMLGYLLYDRAARAQQLCRHKKVFYVKESFTRMHDLRVGRVRDVTWASMVVHRCRPADFHLVHYYFSQEYRMPQLSGNVTVTEEEAAARRVAEAWVSAAKSQMPQLNAWEDLPSVRWVSRDRQGRAPRHIVDVNNSVAVYLNPYNELHIPRWRVYDGYSSNP